VQSRLVNSYVIMFMYPQAMNDEQGCAVCFVSWLDAQRHVLLCFDFRFDHVLLRHVLSCREAPV
jgi:hypothetical protein